MISFTYPISISEYTKLTNQIHIYFLYITKSHMYAFSHELTNRPNYFSSNNYKLYLPISLLLHYILTDLSRYVTFFAGSLLSVLIILTVVDEDFLAVKNILAAMTLLTVLVSVFRSCIPDEVPMHSIVTKRKQYETPTPTDSPFPS